MNLTKIDGNAFSTDYSAGFFPGAEPVLPEVIAKFARRVAAWPLISAIDRTGYRYNLLAVILGASVEDLRQQLFGWFDPEDETPIKLSGDLSGTEYYRYVICESIKPYGQQPDPPKSYIITVANHGDPRWREETPSTDTWNITASGQTKAISNSGKDIAFPILTITPTGGKTGGYAYKRFTAIRWRIDQAVTTYPVDIGDNSFDTASLTPAKMQADGDDLRVTVDGVEVDRWLDDMDTATTSVWINLNFVAKQEGTIVNAITAIETVETIDVNEDISGFPATGILMINSEIFTYTGKNESLKRFTGVTRAAKGSTAAAHSADDTIIWIQHEIWILYGNSTASAPVVDDNYEPAFALATSTNTSWDYDIFGEDDGLRPAAWSKMQYWNLYPYVDLYTGNRGASADPWSEMGWDGVSSGGDAWDSWKIEILTGITEIEYDGEQNGPTTQNIRSYFWYGSGWTTIGNNVLGAVGSWTAFGPFTDTLPSTRTLIHIIVTRVGLPDKDVEIQDLTITLDNTQTPAITDIGEMGNYSLACTITNTTTGDALELEYTMELNEDLELDTDAKTVIYLADSSSQFQALTLTGGARRHWLYFAVGSNTIQFDDTGTNGVTIDFEWEERLY